MKPIKLSPFKQILMTILVAIVNITFHVRVSYGGAMVANPYIASSCYAYCSAQGFAVGISGYAASAAGCYSFQGHNYLAHMCYCFTATEATAASQACAISACASITGMIASGRPMVNLIGAAYNSTALTALSSVYVSTVCRCMTGYTQTSTYACAMAVTCPAGQYRQGTTCISCSAGRYASTSGLTTCTVCPTGYYASSSGMSTCTRCASLVIFFGNSAGPTSTGIQYGVTTGTGKSKTTDCYMPGISEGTHMTNGVYFWGFKDGNHRYDFTSSCYYN